MDNENPPRRSKKLVRWGVAFTIVYVLIVGGIAAAHWRIMAGLTPDEWGGYLSGVFGPLAFLWLVLGYFQQGEELRHSAEALRLQGEELRHSVEQQRQLVEVTRDQIEFEKLKIQSETSRIKKMNEPIFKFHFIGDSLGLTDDNGRSSIVTNVGKDCTKFEIYVDGNIICSEGVFQSGSSRALYINRDRCENEIYCVKYIDGLGESECRTYRICGRDFVEI